MIGEIIKERKLSQSQAAKILGITQAKVSAVCMSRLKDVSLGKLLDFLTKLDRDVKIVVKQKPHTHPAGEISVAV